MTSRSSCAATPSAVASTDLERGRPVLLLRLLLSEAREDLDVVAAPAPAACVAATDVRVVGEDVLPVAVAAHPPGACGTHGCIAGSDVLAHSIEYARSVEELHARGGAATERIGVVKEAPAGHVACLQPSRTAESGAR